MQRKPFRLTVLLVLLCTLAPSAAGLAGPPPQQGDPPEDTPFSDRRPAQVVLETPEQAGLLMRSGIDVVRLETLEPNQPFPRPDQTFVPLRAIVYVNAKDVAWLQRRGLAAQAIPPESLGLTGVGVDAPPGWPSYNDLVLRMQAIAADHPDIVRLISIGQSVQGRDLWMLKISDNPDLQEDEPEFKYSSTMHGNESVGTEMLLRLADLLTDNYGSVPTLTELVDEMEIWLLPLHNPDGYAANQRYNANGVDLNRNFPDRITDPVDDPTIREPENQAIMYWTYDHSPVMGANYHTGALVVNVPWDSIVQSNPDYAPDDEIFLTFGVDYARRNSMIWNGGFPQGVTRGWEWYIIRGGMQDWAYLWHGEHHITIENSNSQPPPYTQMDAYWDLERPAMLWWMRRPLTGLRGLVTDANSGDPLHAWVLAEQIGKEVYTDPDVGDYHRMLLAGAYTVTAGAICYLPQTIQVTLPSSDTVVVHDFALQPAPHWTVQGTVSETGSGRPLQATVEILETGSVTQSRPLDGYYALSLCAGSYTMRVSAPGYRSQERPITLDGDQVQDFVLQPAPCILLVDDDQGESYETYYQGALDALGKEHDLWTVSDAGSPSASTLSTYGQVIWLTGDDYNDTLSASDQSALGSYLDGGGRLLISGQDIGYDIGQTAFYVDYLHADYLSDNTNSYDLAGLDYLGGLNLHIQGGDGAGNQDYPSEILPVGGGAAVLDYSGTPQYGGVAYQDGTYGVVYFSFGYEAIDNQADRTEVMSRTLAWLGGCEEPGGYYAAVLDDSQALGQPGQAVTHTFSLSNAGTLSDSYALSLTTGAWPAALLESQVGPLAPGQAAPVRVRVDVPTLPLTASLLLSDVLSVQASSLASPTLAVQGRGTTYVQVGLDLELTAALTRQLGLAGRTVSYTLVLSNSGAYSDSYALSLSGNTWTTTLEPTRTALLAPGGSVPLTVTVELPPGPGPAGEALTVRASSQRVPPLYAERTLHTRRYWGGVEIAGSQAWGRPGQAVTHTFVLSNASSLSDTYQVDLRPGSWPAALLDAQVGPLEPGQAGQARVRVDIPLLPLSESLLLSDVLRLQVSSTLVPEVGAGAAGATYAGAELGVALSAARPAQWARPGRTVTYTLILSNSGAYSDSYALALSGNAWSTTLEPTRTGRLGPGRSVPILVRVVVPAGPGGAQDTTVVRAASSWDAAVQAEQALSTLRGWGVYLPVVWK